MAKVCIIRNAQAETNSGILRIIDALTSDSNNDVITLTRNRDHSNSKSFEKKNFEFKGKTIINDELQLKGETGGGLKNIIPLISYQYLIFQWLKKNHKYFEYIHAFDLDAGLPAYFISKMKNKKFVYHIADFYADSRSNIPKILYHLIKKLEFFLINRADATIICTEEREQQISGSNPKRLEIIHNSPVMKNPIAETNSNAVFTIAYVGHLSKRRFIEDVIEVVKGMPDVRLVLAGFGESQDKVKQYASEHENIEFLGKVTAKQAIKIYSQADAMFAVYNPTVRNHRFSAPNKVYEAMMLGKPIIVANHSGINSLVEDNRMGICIDYNRESFKSAVNKLKNDIDLYEKMSINARESYKFYDWQTMQDRLLALYKNI